MDFDDDDFKPDEVFGSRGITREVAEIAFHRYGPGGPRTFDEVFNDDRGLEMDPAVASGKALAISKYWARCVRLASKAPGMMMRRWAVPEADKFIVNEQRPEWAIWAGDTAYPVWMGGIPEPHVHDERFPSSDPFTRAGHVSRERVDPAHVFKGVTRWEYDELAELDGWELTYGADHFGTDISEPHRHIDIAKYVFKPNEKGWQEDPDSVGADGAVKHQHSHYRKWQARVGHEAFHHAPDGSPRDQSIPSLSREVSRHLKTIPPEAGPFERLYEMAAGVAQVDIKPDWPHVHYEVVDVTSYAKRLSWHPYRRAERWQNDRVFFALEGCMKEAALVSAGQATFSCPSVTLWDCPEFQPFAERHLRDKTVYVVCDSDWEPRVRRMEDDKVISQALLARDRLRRLGVDAHVASPPQPADVGCTAGHEKHGADDHLGPCNPAAVEDLLEVIVEPRTGMMRTYLENQRQGQPGRWREGLQRDLEVLQWLATYTAHGRTSMSLRSITRRIQFAAGAPAEDGEHSFENKVEAVRVAVHSLAEQSAILIHGDLRDRQGKHLERVRKEWTGSIEVAPALRADVRTRAIG